MCESGAKTFCTLHSEVWVPGMGLESPWIPQPNLPHGRWRWWWGELGDNYEGDFEDCLNIALSGIADHDEDKLDNVCGQVGSLLGEHRGRGGRDWQLSGEQYCQHVSWWWSWRCYFEKPKPFQKVGKSITNLFLLGIGQIGWVGSDCQHWFWHFLKVKSLPKLPQQPNLIFTLF